jgi:prepilin-type N-terminal cleavage/methylation domain-containing protein
MRLQGNGAKAMKGAARGFTLVEILFAVLVLAIALLGLGAFFPTVIRTQQVAQDATLGVVAAQSAEAVLRGRVYRTPTGALGFEEYLGVAARAQSSFLPDDSSWVLGVPDTDIGPDGTAALIIGNDPILSPRISLGDRLYPLDDAGVSEPKLVWDAAFRRLVPRGAGTLDAAGSDAVQVAIFVRRVDPRLRAPQGVPIFRAIQDASLTAAQRRWPVSASLTASSLGEPSLDGRVVGEEGTNLVYSQIMPVEVEFAGYQAGPRVVRPDLLRLTRVLGTFQGMDLERAFELMSQPGQQIVDNFGNIYSVLGPEPEGSGVGPNTVRISPPVPEGVRTTVNGNPATLYQVLMTPQVPAAVRVFTVKP